MDEKDQKIAYLEKIIGLLPGNLYWKDRQGKYLGCNENFANILKLASYKEVIGKTDYDFLSEEKAQAIVENDLEVMNSNSERSLEESAFDQNHEPAIYLTRKTPLHNEMGEVVGLLGISLNISERKKYERALQEAKEKAESANRAKSDFLAVVSHELRIPLTGILGMAQLLEGDNLYPEQHAQLADLVKSGDHLLSLVNDLLDIAKLEAGKMELNFAPVNLRKLLGEMLNIIGYQARLKGLELLLDYPLNITSNIISDAKALRQIILNLTGNAIKFTASGHVLIKVDCVKQSATQARFILNIEDTGIGIAPDKLGIVFDRFMQADGTRTRRYGGTGLGLAITREYIEAMGGTISVQSELGKGASFTCNLPVELAETAAITNPWDAYSSEVKILVVDDTLRGQILCRHINSSLCEVCEGKEALNLLRIAQQSKRPFDIVIIDQQLHTMDATALCQAIVQQQKLRQPMLLLLAFKLAIPSKKQAQAIGFFDFLAKPVQPVEILIAMTAAWERWIENKQRSNKAPIFSKEKRNIIRALLVEDEPIIQRVHKLMLDKMQCQVEIAQTGKEALAMFAAKDYDIIFLDIGLPDIDGFEVARQMRDKEVETGSYTPIIGVTGFADKEDREKCLLAGMNEVAVKPVKPEEFNEILHNWQKKS